ncbi:hypothetical protein ACNOYE_36775 [Nannocystaceae bacterium ST9]
MKRLASVSLPIVLVVLSACRSKSVPDEWKDLTPTEHLAAVVDAATDAENLTVVYADTDADAIRAGFRKLAEAKGMTHVYACEYPDSRKADGYLKSPDSLEWTIMAPTDGEHMVMASRKTNTAEFAGLPDEAACKWLNR